MFDTKLQYFLDRHGTGAYGLSRMQRLGCETLEQAWDKVSDEDLIWIVTRPGVMSQEQRRLFLIMVLSSIEDKLTDVRSLNILTKLRTKETIKSEDRDAAESAAEAASAAARAEAEAEAEAKAAQAKWVRENFRLCDLHTN